MTQKDTKQTDKKEAAQDTKYSVRLTISSTKLDSIQKVTNDLVQNSKQLMIKLKGPVKMPNKTLRITCRKTPCGQGTKTWDRFEMRIYKRYFHFIQTSNLIKQLTNLKLPPHIQFDIQTD